MAITDIIHGLTTEHLVCVTDKIMLTKETYQAFSAMAKRAKDEANLDLAIASGFRDFNRQNLIYSAKFLGLRQVLNKDETPADISNLSLPQKVRLILYFSAIPGLSRHHFGTDIDIYAKNLLPENQHLDLTNIEYSTGSQAPLTAWLSANLEDFGFFRPFAKSKPDLASELWHISFYKEANNYTRALDQEECLNFIKEHNLFGLEELTTILETEFEKRFKIFG